MKVLFVTSEAAPIKKFGGLGDFSGSLPKALEKLDVDVDLMLPYYSDAKVENLKLYKSLDLAIDFDGQTTQVEIWKSKLPNSNVDLILPKYSKTFSGNMLSDVEFFSFFDKVVVEYVKAQYNTYDVIHCNDWHTGFITHLLHDELGEERPKTLLTIHNLAYAGVSSPEIMREVGFIPGQHPLLDWDVSNGDVSMLLQGIASSDYVNTVSKSYASEIINPKVEGELNDIIRSRGGRFSGILNGIDYSELPRNYTEADWKPHKVQMKSNLMKQLNLGNSTAPIFSFVSRLDPGQKGLDILLDVVPYIVEKGGQFVLLGTGAPEWESKFKDLALEPKLSGALSININFDVKLAGRIYEGSDFFLVPSKYEPCGLTQMMAMWYGTLPIVHNVGGLKDTVQNRVTGFSFDLYNSQAFKDSLDESFAVFEDTALYDKMVLAAMKEDNSWGKSAKEYKSLYHVLVDL